MVYFMTLLCTPLTWCLLLHGCTWRSAPPATQPASDMRHIAISLLQDYQEVQGLSKPWPHRTPHRLQRVISESGNHTVTVTIPGIGTFMSPSERTTISQRNERIIIVTIVPLEKPLPLGEIEIYLEDQLAQWELEPKDSDSLVQMMELVHKYVGKQGQPRIQDLVIDGKKIPIDEETVEKIGVPNLRGRMRLREDIVFDVYVRPLLSDKSRGYVTITFGHYRTSEVADLTRRAALPDVPVPGRPQPQHSQPRQGASDGSDPTTADREKV